MGVLSTLLKPKAATLRNPPDWLYDALGGRKTSAGIRVNETTAWNHSAVYACIRLISETIGSLPLFVYRQQKRGKDKLPRHPVYSLLHDAPNAEMSAMVFRETLMANTLSWGNGYAYIERAGNYRPTALLPLPSNAVTPKRDDRKQLYYEYRDEDGIQHNLNPLDVLHIPMLGSSGIVGMSPIRLARETVGLAMAAEEFGSTFFGNGSHASGVLEVPTQLGDVAYDRLKKQLEEYRIGEGNANKTLLLEYDTKWKTISVPPDDAQFLETRKFQIEEVARWYNVPPHKIKHLERSTFNNIEHQGIEFVVDTIRPWLVRLEQEFKRKLFNSDKERDIFPEHSVDGLLRGDIKSRFEAYNTGVMGGWMNRNEVREKENMDAVEGLDEYLVPLNMSNGQDSQDQEPPPPDANDMAAFIRKAAQRCAKRELGKFQEIARRFDGEEATERLEGFFAEHAKYVMAAMPISAGDTEIYINLGRERIRNRNMGDWETVRTDELMEITGYATVVSDQQ